MISQEQIEKVYGPKCSGDNPFAARARFHQSWYRQDVLKEDDYGFGPDKNSPIRYGNILVNGEMSGRNFLSPEIFEYAKYRTRFLKSGETIKEYRLFNNMLSSQPMCFNLFFPLKRLFETNYKRGVKVISSCFPSLDISGIIGIDIEYLPYPVDGYLCDHTAFDAMILYLTGSGERNILAIETKYVEKLGVNSSSDLTKQIELVNSCEIFNSYGIEMAQKGFGQLGRNFLLAEKFRINNRLDKAFAVVISPEGNDSSHKEITEFRNLLNAGFKDRIFFQPLENTVESLKDYLPKSLYPWLTEFYRRYLDFAASDFLYKEHKA